VLGRKLVDHDRRCPLPKFHRLAVPTSCGRKRCPDPLERDERAADATMLPGKGVHSREPAHRRLYRAVIRSNPSGAFRMCRPLAPRAGSASSFAPLSPFSGRRAGGARRAMRSPKDEATLQGISLHRSANSETSVCEVRWLQPDHPVMVSLGVLPAARRPGAVECPQGPKPPPALCCQDAPT
jgi:hypothetical protein